MARKWSEVKEQRLSEEQRERVETRVRQELVNMTIQDLRKHRNLTQVQLAEVLDVSQPEMSRIENASNPLLSTVRRVVEALGGELEVTASFSDGEKVKLEGM